MRVVRPITARPTAEWRGQSQPAPQLSGEANHSPPYS